MAEEFVNKEVFDARMDRMEALLEKTLTEMKMEVSAAVSGMRADNEKLRSEVKEEVNGLHNEIGGLRAEIRVVDERVNSVNARIDSVQNTVYWGFALMGLILAFTTFAPALAEFVKNIRKPAVTMEDVEKAIAAAIRQSSQLNLRS